MGQVIDIGLPGGNLLHQHVLQPVTSRRKRLQLRYAHQISIVDQENINRLKQGQLCRELHLETVAGR